MLIGFGRAEVNPPLGMPMEGLGQKGGIQSIHDDLWIRTLWIDQDGERFLIVSLDLLFFDRADTDRIVGAVSRKFDVSASRMLLNFTHTHAGPRTSRWAYSGAPDPHYLSKVEAGIISAAAEALANLEPVTLWAGETTTTVPVSRRKLDEKGQAQWAPSEEAEVCEHLPFCLFKREDGSVKSALFSASCHPSMIYSLDVSADFPGAAVRALNQHFGIQSSVFLQGAAGDTKPRQVAKEGWWKPGNWEEMETAGRQIAQRVIEKTAAGLIRVAPDLKVFYRTMDWPMLPAPSIEELKAIEADAATRTEKRTWAADMLSQLSLRGALPSAVPVTLQGVQLGKGLRLVALEGELVGELGNLIRRQFSDGVTFPLGYSNGCAIYLPSDKQLPEHGYEVDSYWEYHWPAPLAPGIDARLIKAVAELKNGLAS